MIPYKPGGRYKRNYSLGCSFTEEMITSLPCVPAGISSVASLRAVSISAWKALTSFLRWNQPPSSTQVSLKL